jgi:hypothetical protein
LGSAAAVKVAEEEVEEGREALGWAFEASLEGEVEVKVEVGS